MWGENNEPEYEPARGPPFRPYHNMESDLKYSAARIMNLTITIIQSTNYKLNHLEQHIKSARARSAPYEIGYEFTSRLGPCHRIRNSLCLVFSTGFAPCISVTMVGHQWVKWMLYLCKEITARNFADVMHDFMQHLVV